MELDDTKSRQYFTTMWTIRRNILEWSIILFSFHYILFCSKGARWMGGRASRGLQGGSTWRKFRDQVTSPEGGFRFGGWLVFIFRRKTPPPPLLSSSYFKLGSYCPSSGWFTSLSPSIFLYPDSYFRFYTESSTKLASSSLFLVLCELWTRIILCVQKLWTREIYGEL